MKSILNTNSTIFFSVVRQLADIAMTEAANYKSEYGSPIPVKYLTDRVSNYVHAYTLYSALRPFGTTIMMGSYTDIDGPELYCIENSGLYYRYWGCAVSIPTFFRFNRPPAIVKTS